MKKYNYFISAGLLIISLMLILKHFAIQLPDFIQGFGYGIGIALELMGAYLVNHDISKIKNYKRKLWRNIIGGRK